MKFNAEIVGWKIYYANGMTASSVFARATAGQREWEEAPSEGVVGVILYFAEMNGDENYVRMMVDTDYYWREIRGGKTLYGQGNAMDPSILLNPRRGQVKHGKLIDDVTYRRIYEVLYKDRTWNGP